MPRPQIIANLSVKDEKDLRQFTESNTTRIGRIRLAIMYAQQLQQVKATLLDRSLDSDDALQQITDIVL